ncbi:MAG: hypothetical protein ABIQ40_00890 [Bacteroidia bacterium]
MNLIDINSIEQNNDWKEFIKNVPLKQDNLPLIVHVEAYEEDYFFDYAQVGEQSDIELKRSLDIIITQLKEKIGQVYLLDLSVIKGYVCYRFRSTLSWISDIASLNTLIELMEEPDEEIDETEDDNTPQKKKLNKEEILSYVDRVLKEDDFLFMSSPALRKSYIDEYFGDELHWTNINDIIFRTEIELDKRLRQRVGELKNEGKNGAQIMSILRISRDRLRKYN